MGAPLKQTIIALQEAIQRSQASGAAVALPIYSGADVLDWLGY